MGRRVRTKKTKKKPQKIFFFFFRGRESLSCVFDESSPWRQVIGLYTHRRTHSNCPGLAYCWYQTFRGDWRDGLLRSLLFHPALLLSIPFPKSFPYYRHVSETDVKRESPLPAHTQNDWNQFKWGALYIEENQWRSQPQNILKLGWYESHSSSAYITTSKPLLVFSFNFQKSSFIYFFLNKMKIYKCVGWKCQTDWQPEWNSWKYMG